MAGSSAPTLHVELLFQVDPNLFVSLMAKIFNVLYCTLSSLICERTVQYPVVFGNNRVYPNVAVPK